MGSLLLTKASNSLQDKGVHFNYIPLLYLVQSCDLDLLEGNASLISPLLSRFPNQSLCPKTSTWRDKTGRETNTLRFLLTIAKSKPLAATPTPLFPREKTLHKWMPQTLRPVQACVITHSFFNNRGTNWQSYRLDFPVKWPADTTGMSSQV